MTKVFNKQLMAMKVSRTHCLNRILNSPDSLKVIVSGPGTGKTYTFLKLFENGNEKNCLALTFINNLADKLAKDLAGKAKALTLHKFCKSLLHKNANEGIQNDFELYPKLDLLIEKDANLILSQSFSFKTYFEKNIENSNEIKFYMERSNFYNAVSFNDCVYRCLKILEKNPEIIPVIGQIVVDEYQDFNKLEVDFINLLATQNSLLIVGDDDQALYGKLRHASPDYLRKIYESPDYAKYPLPFSSRCPEVIVKAVSDVIRRAKEMGKLKGRIDKGFLCYLPDKLEDSEKYPLITYAHCSVQSSRSPYISKYIHQKILKIPHEEILSLNGKADYTVLITGPKQYLKQIQEYFLELDENNYVIEKYESENYKRAINIIEGYQLLLEKPSSNLAWRIILEYNPLSEKEMENILRKTQENNTILLVDLLPGEYVLKHRTACAFLRKIEEDSTLQPSEKKELEVICNCGIIDIKEELQNLKNDGKKTTVIKSETNSINIKFTTYVGCKGLSAGYVFIIGLNDGSLPRINANPADIEICQFIVALTRTVKKCYLLSAGRFAGQKQGHPSVFLDWISKKRIESRNIDSQYWLDKN